MIIVCVTGNLEGLLFVGEGFFFVVLTKAQCNIEKSEGHLIFLLVLLVGPYNYVVVVLLMHLCPIYTCYPFKRCFGGADPSKQTALVME